MPVTDFSCRMHGGAEAEQLQQSCSGAHTPSAAYGASASGCCATGSGAADDSSWALMLHSSTAADPSTCHDYGGSSAQCAGLGSASLTAGEARVVRPPAAAAAAAPACKRAEAAGAGFWAAAARAFELVHVQTLNLQELAQLEEAATLVMDSAFLSRLPPLPAAPATPAPCPPSPRPTAVFAEEAAPRAGGSSGSSYWNGHATASGPQLRSDLHLLWEDQQDSSGSATELPQLWPGLRLPDVTAADGWNSSSCDIHHRSLIPPCTATGRRYGAPSRVLHACGGAAAYITAASGGGDGFDAQQQQQQQQQPMAFLSPPESRVAGLLLLPHGGPDPQPWQQYMRAHAEACGLRHAGDGGDDNDSACCSFRHGHQYCVGEEVLLVVDVEEEEAGSLLRAGGSSVFSYAGCEAEESCGGLANYGGDEDWAATAVAMDWSGGRLARRLAGLRATASGVAPRAAEWVPAPELQQPAGLLGHGGEDDTCACGGDSPEVSLPPVAELVGLRRPQARPAGRLLRFLDAAAPSSGQ
ncbi:hypothetical protein HXX76_008624 [Chlamydomonas incerta]|uniref:Uncharacterized protein n=1 Tax=Chlamydomonas incerta TaxID=51695 RepID=A0A835STM1_CHLIN|nr:hypothetical protein HXX76_008624 [Chlamydomonas incerta]|eukprot:KAG2432893.1 hypothetical protein HXX76_008624 [Chlamydomonas incerta]